LFYHEQKRFTPTLAKEVIKQEVSGLNKDEIMNRLSTRDNVQGVDVDFWPFWVKQAPSDPRRTSVEIELD
jgi:hypothetical protein